MISQGANPMAVFTEAPAEISSVAIASLEDSHVYVHCHCRHSVEGLLIRIWKTTFLNDISSGSKSSLIHTENISMAPQWTMIPASQPYSFLLIFTRLPHDCRAFDFVEEIPQPGGFSVRNIPRNETDVYHIDIL